MSTGCGRRSLRWLPARGAHAARCIHAAHFGATPAPRSHTFNTLPAGQVAGPAPQFCPAHDLGNSLPSSASVAAGRAGCRPGGLCQCVGDALCRARSGPGRLEAGRAGTPRRAPRTPPAAATGPMRTTEAPPPHRPRRCPRPTRRQRSAAAGRARPSPCRRHQSGAARPAAAALAWHWVGAGGGQFQTIERSAGRKACCAACAANNPSAGRQNRRPAGRRGLK